MIGRTRTKVDLQRLRLPGTRFVTTANEFAVQDLPDCVDAEGKLTLLTPLVTEEALQPTPA